ncbi:hypothetical protein [Candidatus Ichthyocystis sparus]|uniref:hypothetical protein n=1 Tax=Candidatus Ichthyocystis sparus TaxID=1561004 RepID=UPI000B82CD60|nr:hypothetical protein [Candidatus Ichthyocystis sparus]
MSLLSISSNTLESVNNTQESTPGTKPVKSGGINVVAFMVAYLLVFVFVIALICMHKPSNKGRRRKR